MGVVSEEQKNTKILSELVVDPLTPDPLRVQIINKLLEGIDSSTFFQTIYQEALSRGECPECHHVNHWCIPEDELNRLGWVTHEQDDNVKRMTTALDCEQWQEACKKRKVSI